MIRPLTNLSPVLIEQSPVCQPPAWGEAGDNQIPDDARSIALARFDLLTAWNSYREEHRKNGRKFDEIDRDFERLYNYAKFYPHIYTILREISVKSLYRWKKELEDTNDWRRLVPKYGYGKGEPGLMAEEKQYFRGFLLMDSENSIGAATRYTKFRLKEHGIPSPSSPGQFRRWAEWFKAKHYAVYVGCREGKKALLDKVIFSIKRDWSQIEVGQLLFADGHRLNFQVINPFTGKPCRATLVAYMCAKSWYLVGYEIMVEESTQAIAAALRNAIINLGKFPQFAYQDNGKAFRSKFFTGGTPSFEEAGFQGLFGKFNIIPIFALPYNARAKSIERLFKEFSEFEKLVPSYIGNNVTRKPAYMKRNEKEMRAIHNDWVPSFEEAVQIVERFRQFLGAQACPRVEGKTIIEAFEEGRGPGINADELDDLMLVSETRLIRQNGIRFLNAEYYNDNLFGLKEKAVIKYSLFDLSKVKVYTTGGQFLGIAERWEPMNPVVNYIEDPKDMAHYQFLMRKQKGLLRDTFKDVRRIKGVDNYSLIEITPRIVKKLEHADIALPPIEMRIPIEALHTGDSPESTASPVILGQSPPFFREMYERYDYLMQTGINSEEDRRWIEDYKKSEEYRMLYEVIPAQQVYHDRPRGGM